MSSIVLLAALLAGVGPASANPNSGADGPALRASPPASVTRPDRGPVRAESAKKAAARDELAMPIGEVTVFSDRARVRRMATVSLGAGPRRLRLPALPATVDPSSVRLEATSARVLRVDVRRARLDELPRAEVEELLRALEKAVDAETALASRRAAFEDERELLASVRPGSSPLAAPEGPPVLLETAGWQPAIAFFDTREAAAEQAIRGLDAELRVARAEIGRLRGRAAQLAAGLTSGPSLAVEALVEGEGAARLTLTYLVAGARWVPAYDVRFQPGSADVEVDFAGLVSQTTGEDWEQASLVLSTAVPATTAALPRLASWKIGERDQFIPRPVVRPEPPAAPPPLANQRVDDDAGDAELRRALLGFAAEGNAGIGTMGRGDDKPRGDARAAARAAAEHSRREQTRRKAAPPSAPAPSMGMADFDAPAELEAYQPAHDMVMKSLIPEQAFTKSDARAESSRTTEAIGFGAPAGWRAPALTADLPASLAGGYDYAYRAARRESVRSGGEVRRVGLHTARFPARPSVSIFPALRRQAYLVAEVTNGSDRPLLRGQANLFVGADLQGQALLETTAAGEKVTLPLGVDEAIAIERQVNVISGEKGLLSKSEVTRYEVVIELLNPRAAPVNARVVDQIPLAGNAHVAVALEKTEPWAIHDKAEGTLEWQIPLKPREKRQLKFVYTLTRPRGAEMSQW